MLSGLYRSSFYSVSRSCLQPRVVPTIRLFTVFKTAQPKSVRNDINRHSERNLKKEYIQHKGKSHSSTLWLERQLRDPYTIRVSCLYSL